MGKKYKSMWLVEATQEKLDETLNDQLIHGWQMIGITPFVVKNNWLVVTYLIIFKSGQ